MTVIDVDPDSATFGTILHSVDLGTKGNETHHWGYTDDRTKIWAGGLFSSRIWILDVATDPARPRVEKVLENIPELSGLSGPHSYYALPGRMLISFLGSAERRPAGGPGRVHQRRQVHPPDRAAREGALWLRRGHQAVAEPHGNAAASRRCATTRSRWRTWT